MQKGPERPGTGKECPMIKKYFQGLLLIMSELSRINGS